ncbi:MAG: BMP family protein [Proteobacteria bacterium]|nr:BMP family protein [Pseudomonadota bacterium]
MPRSHSANLRRPLLLLSALTALAVGACSGESTDSSPPAASDSKAFEVALLTPGSIADGGWNAGAYDGLMRIESELGARVSHVETKTPAEFEEAFRDYADRGFDLVFGHGFEYQDAAATVGAEFPDTIFVTTSGDTVRANVAPMVFELEQATYLCGFLAARMSETGTLGLVGGIELPSIRSTFLAFRAGAEAARPDVDVREVFLGNFEDTAAAREQAQALIEAGADFLLHQANEAGRGVFQAASESARAGRRVFAFGTNRNQNEMAADVVLASATLDIPGAFIEVARRVQSGRFAAEPVRLGMSTGVVALEFNAALAKQIPAELASELAGLEARIRAGELVVPRGDF